MIAITSHATKKPSAPTIIIQGTNTSENLSSGRLSAPVKRLTSCDPPTILIVCFCPRTKYESHFPHRAVGRAKGQTGNRQLLTSKLVEHIRAQNFHQPVVIPVVHRNGDDDRTFNSQRFFKRRRNLVGTVYLQPGSTEGLG
jgi:hypothetical protein